MSIISYRKINVNPSNLAISCQFCQFLFGRFDHNGRLFVGGQARPEHHLFSGPLFGFVTFAKTSQGEGLRFVEHEAFLAPLEGYHQLWGFAVGVLIMNLLQGDSANGQAKAALA